MNEENKVLPSVVFEGPFGRFWPLKEVPTEAIVKAIRELMDELHHRGYEGIAEFTIKRD